jgi:hypothetical protein
MMSLEVGRLDVAVSGASGERVAVGGWRNLIVGWWASYRRGQDN